MRICSLLPGATEVVATLGLADDLVAISHECDYPPEIRQKPVIIRSIVDPKQTSSPNIDRQVREALREGQGLYRIDEALLRRLDPDLILTQSLCDVCAVTPTEVKRVLADLARRPQMISLDATDLQGVFRDIEVIGVATGRDAKARWLVEALTGRLAKVRALVEGETPRRVACIEWLDPLYCAGHWVPEMVELAGGLDGLGTRGQYSVRIDWQQILDFDPEVIVVMPCGYTAEKAVDEYRKTNFPAEWQEVQAVKDSRVFAVHASAYFSRPGPRLVEGVEILHALLHEDFSLPLPVGSWAPV